MPDFVKGLRDIKECNGTACLVFEGFVNPVKDVMRLFDGGVRPLVRQGAPQRQHRNFQTEKISAHKFQSKLDIKTY
jgi:hypothetical protein